MNLADATISPLNAHTPTGLFLAAGGCLHWVIESGRGKAAVQLAATSHRPAFAFDWLESAPIALGVWLGKAHLALGRSSGQSQSGKSGIIIHKHRRYYVKASSSWGQAQLIKVGQYLAKRTEFCELYPRWELRLANGDCPLPAFTAPPSAPRLATYADRDVGGLVFGPIGLVG